MIEFDSKYGKVKVFAKTVEQTALSQIHALADSCLGKDSHIRIMPDVHTGAGCVIGTTMQVTDKIAPNLVGVDIGCGMETVCLGKLTVDCAQLDKVIHESIPSGMNINSTRHPYAAQIDLSALRCASFVNIPKGYLSIGTLGGGNHFCELSRGEDGEVYFIVHSGSRNIGKQVCEWYNKAATLALRRKNADNSALIAQLKSDGRKDEIADILKKTHASGSKLSDGFAWLEGQGFLDYIHDMKIIQQFALLNRKAIVQVVSAAMGWQPKQVFTTIHNYIDTETMILRKGAIRANKGETVLIPINMRDGSLLCEGKGNPDWNYSAPHGAGRLMSRRQARDSITLEQFERDMRGIYSSSVTAGTIDESPLAYKPIHEIVECIGEAADVLKVLRPLYNFKACGD